MAGSSVLSSAVTSTYYNMILQMFFRLLTFGMNAFILRSISTDVLGVVNVRLALLVTSIQLLSREAFRRALLSNVGKERQWSQTINLLWLVIPLGTIMAGVLSFIWIFVLKQPDEAIAHYGVSVLIFALASVIEELAEPFYVVAQILLFVRLSVFIEGAALAIRCIITVILVKFFPHLGLLGFALAQVIYAVLFAALFMGYFSWYIYKKASKDEDFPFRSIRDFFPCFNTGKSLVNEQEAALTWRFFFHSVLKQTLTEGEGYVMTASTMSFGDQGVYDTITKLGALAPRIIFKQLEDGGYLFFSKTLQREIATEQQDKVALEQAAKYLKSLLKVVLIIGVTILVFGQAYSFLLLDIYGGNKLSSGTGPMLLRWYCVYVLLLAINGVTECFCTATMNQSQVSRFSYLMTVFTVIYLFFCIIFTSMFGTVGFIYANCANMMARIIYSVVYIRKFYTGTTHNPLAELMLPVPVIIAYVVSYVITSFSEIYLCSGGLLLRVAHIAIGGVCLLVVVITICVYEPSVFTICKKVISERTNRKEKQK